MCRKEMDYALGYFSVLPCDFKNPENKEVPFLYIHKDCPPDLKERILSDWPRIKRETIKRHEQGLFSSQDYFY